MSKRRDIPELIYDIKCEIPGFSKEELIDYTKIIALNLHKELKNNSDIKVKCGKELKEKLKNNLQIYRATKDVDRMNIQYAELYDCFRKDGQLYIQVYLSVLFYDQVINNNEVEELRDKYWNDIWIVTFKKDRILNNVSRANCPNCGAKLIFNAMRNIYKCEYCDTSVYNYRNVIEWELEDIIVKK